MIGGYKIINLKSEPIGVSTEQTHTEIPGIYEAIESTMKPILLEGIVLDIDGTETEIPPCFIAPITSSGDFVFTIYTYTLTVTDDDEIYYTAAE